MDKFRSEGYRTSQSWKCVVEKRNVGGDNFCVHRNILKFKFAIKSNKNTRVFAAPLCILQIFVCDYFVPVPGAQNVRKGRKNFIRRCD